MNKKYTFQVQIDGNFTEKRFLYILLLCMLSEKITKKFTH